MDSLHPDLIRGSIDLMVLSVLVDSAAYGYLIQQRLKENSNELVDLKAGTLYPVLHRLEQQKLLRTRWENETGRRRKWYELTVAGRKQLKSRAEQWQTYAECIRKFLDLGQSPRPARGLT